MSFVQRLAAFNSNSWRYIIANIYWSDEKIRKARVGKFYLMFACSFIPFLILLSGFLILAPLLWACGFTATLIKDRGDQSHANGLVYQYLYSPRKGQFHRFAPWYFLLPSFVTYMLVSGRFRIMARDVGLGSIGIGLGLALAALCQTARRHHLSARWHRFWAKANPPVQVRDQDKSVSITG